jgi:iron complex transport system substrate-binding protein
VSGHADRAQSLVADLEARRNAVRRAVAGRPRPRVLVLEWTDPPFAPGHWVPEMVLEAGGDNALGTPAAKSVRVTWDDVRRSAPDVVVAAPCGYHLDGAAELAREMVDAGSLPGGTPVWAVDANASFARPGPRLVDGIEALAGILHPEAAPAPSSAMARRVR